MSIGRLKQGVAFGLLIGLLAGIGALSPWGMRLEERVGLQWLFQWRGARPVPVEVVVVTIDADSAQRLGVSSRPDRWPRRLHAELVGQLVERGAGVIVFDMMFKEPRDRAGDEALAQAIAAAGNVALFAYTEKQVLESGVGGVLVQRLMPPIAPLAQAAAAVAPFVLPKVPLRVAQYWKFLPGAGDAPTLPAVALQLGSRHVQGRWREVLNDLNDLNVADGGRLNQASTGRDSSAQLTDWMRAVRELFVLQSSVADDLARRLRSHPDGSERRWMQALLRLYSGPSSAYLNFYGPPGTLHSVPFHRILDAADTLPELRGATVFVGFSERLQWRQLQDSFTTVFSDPDSGVDLNGVEILATAYANLVDGSQLRFPGWGVQLVSLVLWGVVLGLVARLLPGLWMVAALATLAGAGMAGAAYAFAQAHYWFPWVTPLLVLLPTVLSLALIWQYLDSNRERANIRRAFGYYLPEQAVSRLARRLAAPGGQRERVYGVCLFTDVAGYTALAEDEGEQLERVAAVLDDYFKVIFAPVRRHDGVVSDIKGDSMLALWASRHGETALRRQACQAALEIVAAVDAFNAGRGAAALPTRVGLHYGPLLLGDVGALDHYEHRAVGDIVNTASRVEAANKVLGTRLLVSTDVLRDLDGLVYRRLGRFLLPGKSRPLALCELVGFNDDRADVSIAVCRAFEAALQLFESRHWQAASAAFERLCAQYGTDGPARYYRAISERYLQQPPAPDWDGVLVVD